MGRILAIDPGSRRVGTAISDESQSLARGLCVIAAEPHDALLRRVAQLVAENGVEEIVIGLPRNMNGSYGERAEESLALARELEETFSFVVNTWDERLTTRQAERILLEADLSRGKRRQIIDQEAAAVLLQAYLDARRAKSKIQREEWNLERER